MEALAFGPEYKRSYTGITSLFHSLPKLGLFRELFRIKEGHEFKVK